MGTKINYSYEMMDNYKNFYFAAADKDMQVMCENGINYLFSIGEDNIFYVTKQVTGDEAGWKRYNLMKDLIKELTKGQYAPRAKKFSVGYCKKTNQYIMALVIDSGPSTNDYLYVSSSSQIEKPKWKAISLDDPDTPNDAPIEKIYVFSTEHQTYIIADTEALALCPARRSFIDWKKTYFNYEDIRTRRWIYSPLPEDVKKRLSACMGRSFNEPVDGVYTLGSNLENKKMIIYKPVFNYFFPYADPDVIYLSTDGKNIECIQTLKIEGSPYTHLFACGEGALYVYPYDNQKYGASPYKIAEDSRLTKVKQLYVHNIDERIYVWAFNENGELFYTFCDAKDISKSENITSSKNWSIVLPMLQGVRYACAFKNDAHNSNCFLSYEKDSILNLGEQASDTGLWSSTRVTLPEAVTQMKKFTTYTTRITLTDENNSPLLKEEDRKLYIQSDTPCNVYINGKYCELKNTPCEVIPDASGKVLIFQEAKDTVNAHNFTVWSKDSEKIVIRPGEKSSQKIFDLNSKEKLKEATLPNGEKLVPQDTDDHDIEMIAKSVGVLKDTAATVPSGFMKLKNGMSNAEFLARTDHKGVLLLEIRPESIQAYTGDSALSHMPANINATLQALQAKEGIIDDIIYKAGDIIHWLKNLGRKIYKICIDFIHDTWHFILDLGDKIYRFTITCLNEVMACCEFIFELIKVSVEQLIDYVKFLFDWKDIYRVKEVTKHCITKLTVNYVNTHVAEAKTKVHEEIKELISKIDEWAGLEKLANIQELKNIVSVPVLDIQNPASENQATDMFLADHFTAHYPEVANNLQTSLFEKVKVSEDIVRLFELLAEAAKKEGDIAEKLILQLHSELFQDSKILKYDLLTSLKKIIAIIADASLETCDNIISLLMDLIGLIFKTAIDIIDQPIYIPVFSEILKTIFGIDKFSLLDIFCLLPAAGACILYKTCTGKTPFDEKQYQAWMTLERFEDIKKLMKGHVDTQNEQLIDINGLFTEKQVYMLFHAISGCVGLIETVVTLFAESPIFSNMFNIIGTGMCIAAYCIFGPPNPTMFAVLAFIFIAAKCAISAGGILTSIDRLKSFSPAVEVASAVSSVLEMLYYLIYINYIVIFENDNNELALSAVDIFSSIIDDGKNIVDVVKHYVDEKTRVFLHGIRTVMGGTYDIMQIVLVIMANSMLNTKEPEPIVI